MKPRRVESAARGLLEHARAHPEERDALLRALGAAGSLKAQWAIVDAAIAAQARAQIPSATRPLVFAHPLAVTPAARLRFDIGPFGAARAGAPLVAVSSNVDDWDATRAMSAPGQSESPDSAHYSDLAATWAAGESLALPFSDRAVQAAAETTVMLVPLSRRTGGIGR